MSTRESLARFNNCTHVFTWKESAKEWKVYIGVNDECGGFLEETFTTLKAAKEFIDKEFPSLTYYKGNH